MKINIDADLKNADWTKRTFDLPYKNEEELKKGLGDGYEHFKTLPAYQARPWAKENIKKAADSILKRL